MATTKQVTTLERLGKKAFSVAGNDIGYDVVDITDEKPYESLTNAQVTRLMDLFTDEIKARRCPHCHEKITDDNKSNHASVRYYDDVYGPNCGLS